jgi:hypothetical protein
VITFTFFIRFPWLVAAWFGNVVSHAARTEKEESRRRRNITCQIRALFPYKDFKGNSSVQTVFCPI